MNTNAARPSWRSLAIYICAWFMMVFIMASILAAIGVTDALMRGQPERWLKDGRGAGTLGAIIGVLMGLGLAAAFEERDYWIDVFVAGLGTVTLSGLLAAGAFALAWHLEPKAAPYAGSIIAIPSVVVTFCVIRILQPRRGDGTVS